MDQLFEKLIRVIESLIGATVYTRTADITTTYSDANGFYLYVGVAGTIIGTDYSGGAVNRTFIAGYHPIKMKTITGGTATNLAALYK